ncbi:MAG: zf-TFIIB domain-containing protein [Myxococcota bacterium]
MAEALPTQRECPQCNTVMKPFTVQSRKPDVDVELDRCHNCGGVWFDAGELELATGRKVVKSSKPCDRFCPKCLIPLLNADLTTGVAVETCRSCGGTYLDAKDIATVTRDKPARPPEDVSFLCPTCKQRKPFASAQVTSVGSECMDCATKHGRAWKTGDSESMFGAFISWLRGDEKPHAARPSAPASVPSPSAPPPASSAPRPASPSAPRPPRAASLTCPSCTGAMHEFQVGKLTLDRCTFCRGLWFDGGELEAALGRRPSAKLAEGVDNSRRCPRCTVVMRAAEVGGLRVEFCGQCQGVFLDDGELTAMNGGKPVRVQVDAPPPARPEKQVQDDVMRWLDSLGV